VPRILVVEDEPDVREMSINLLGLLGYEVDGVGSGERAMMQLRMRRYDVVLTDLGLPGMDGWAVARAVKRQAPKVLVGLVSGWEIPPRRDQLLAAGVDFVLPKPFDLDDTERVLTQFLFQR
jgi:CheY-like chemotaxis protein